MNDWLLKINDVDLANKDRKQVIKAVFSGGGVINMVVRRRKSLGGRMVTSVHLTLAGHKGQIEGLCLSGRPADPHLYYTSLSLSVCLYFRLWCWVGERRVCVVCFSRLSCGQRRFGVSRRPASQCESAPVLFFASESPESLIGWLWCFANYATDSPYTLKLLE